MHIGEHLDFGTCKYTGFKTTANLSVAHKQVDVTTERQINKNWEI